MCSSVINELRMQVAGETGRIRVLVLMVAFYFLEGHSADKLINVWKFIVLESDECRREQSRMKRWSMPGKECGVRAKFCAYQGRPSRERIEG